jgi:hypothetical protein
VEEVYSCRLHIPTSYSWGPRQQTTRLFELLLVVLLIVELSGMGLIVVLSPTGLSIKAINDPGHTNRSPTSTLSTSPALSRDHALLPPPQPQPPLHPSKAFVP